MEAKERQLMKEKLEKEEEDLGHKLAESRKRRDYEYAVTNKQLAQIVEQQDADTMEIKANANLEVARLNKTRDIQTSKILSQGKAEAERIKIETDTYIQSKKADAEAIIAMNSAKSLEMEASAELYAAEQLVAKRMYEKKMRGLQMMRGLAHNEKVMLVGNNKDNITAQLVAHQKAGAVLGVNAF